MKQKEIGYISSDDSAMHRAYVNYLKEKCNLQGKTLIHYPDAVEKYMPKYIQKYINPNFDSFYSLDIGLVVARLLFSHKNFCRKFCAFGFFVYLCGIN